MTFAPAWISSTFEDVIVQKSPAWPLYSEHSLVSWRSPLRAMAAPLLASFRRRSTRPPDSTPGKRAVPDDLRGGDVLTLSGCHGVPRPRVPAEQQQERDLGGAQEHVVPVRLSDCRSHDRDDVQDRQDNVRPAADRWPQQEGKEDHHTRDRDVDRHREEEALGDLDPRDLSRRHLLDPAWLEEPEDVPVREQKQHRDPQGRDLESEADPHILDEPRTGHRNPPLRH